jgi:hypothetical protein
VEFAQTSNFTLEQTIRALKNYDPKVGVAIERNLHFPLSKYMSELYGAPNELKSSNTVYARRMFLRCLREYLMKVYPEEVVNGVCRELVQHTALQTGPHAQLLLDPYFFYTTLACYGGLLSSGYSFYLSYTCSTNKFQTRRNFGAGILNVQGHIVNLFGRSRTQLEKHSVIAAEGPFVFKFEGMKELPGAARSEIERIAQMAEDIHQDDAFAAFTLLNQRIWDIWDPENLVTPVFIDDRFFAYLVAEHLSDQNSPVSQLLTDERRVTTVLSGMARASESTVGSMYPYGTDLFWGVAEGRIHELRLIEGELRKTKGRTSSPVPFKPAALAESLTGGDLIPDAFLTFLVGCLLPGFRALGGFFQVAYLPEFIKIYSKTLNMDGPTDQLLNEDLQTASLSAWGMHVLEEPDDVLALICEVGADNLLPKLAERFNNRSLSEITRDLYLFRTHRRWQKVFNEILKT